MGVLRGNIAVLGLGASGMAVARYVLDRAAAGDPVVLTVYDSENSEDLRGKAEYLATAGARVFLGAHVVEPGIALAVVSPGIPPGSLLMASARERAGRLVSELEFAYERSRCRWVAVTGTNGKTTVTSLIAHLLDVAGIPSTAVGNIGLPAIAAIDAATPKTTLIAEVSSFQLALTDTFHPHVAVLLNVAPDHLDWHGSMAAYTADKARVFRNQDSTDMAVIDIDDPGSAPFATKVEGRGVGVQRVSRASLPRCGAGVVDGVLCLDEPSGPLELVRSEELLIRGGHNVSNALAAAAAARSCGARAEALREGLRTFKPIAHRLEPVAVLSQVEYVDDSKATNPGAVSVALEAFPGRPVVLLVGGRSKETPFDEMAERARSACRVVIAFGEARAQIADAMREARVDVLEASTMERAIRRAMDVARPGDVVLLSPGCASFDEFTGYAERGRVFAETVRAAAKGEGS